MLGGCRQPLAKTFYIAIIQNIILKLFELIYSLRIERSMQIKHASALPTLYTNFKSFMAYTQGIEPSTVGFGVQLVTLKHRRIQILFNNGTENNFNASHFYLTGLLANAYFIFLSQVTQREDNFFLHEVL